MLKIKRSSFLSVLKMLGSSNCYKISVVLSQVFLSLQISNLEVFRYTGGQDRQLRDGAQFACASWTVMTDYYSTLMKQE